MGASHDFMRTCAQDELEAIQAYWADQGYVVEGRVVYCREAEGIGHYKVETNLIDGLPRGFRAHHAQRLVGGMLLKDVMQ
ncbi:hypothetical protein PUV47_01315 [Pseudovibrio exalbescens]|uniref:hypothetical protein n=1 Tax=Pseudovibrio exalbescens TaxID=197461 RepID=UPI0023655FBB|nr:hypothetical protein [Pseudovibrio exalbescens]MDD7908540.1 hypothetical protein [Pseudovibrio exalbescens]